MSGIHTYRTSPRRRFWTTFLLLLGTVLIVADLVLLAATLTGRISAIWWVATANAGFWAPVMVAVGVVLRRYDRSTERLMNHGLNGIATVMKINSTGSRVGGNAVLRLDISIAVAGRPVYQASTRTAPAAHLVSMLRRGAQLPVKVDPQTPTRLRIDWNAVEDARAVPGF